MRIFTIYVNKLNKALKVGHMISAFKVEDKYVGLLYRRNYNSMCLTCNYTLFAHMINFFFFFFNLNIDLVSLYLR